MPDFERCMDKLCPHKERHAHPAGRKIFDPAFDMPETAEQAVAVLYAWGSPHCMTFSAERSRRCAELLEAF